MDLEEASGVLTTTTTIPRKPFLALVRPLSIPSTPDPAFSRCKGEYPRLHCGTHVGGSANILSAACGENLVAIVAFRLASCCCRHCIRPFLAFASASAWLLRC